jgi:hypothetical protein
LFLSWLAGWIRRLLDDTERKTFAVLQKVLAEKKKLAPGSI